MKYSFFFILWCYLSLNISSIYAQNISGRILEIEKNPIPFATIEINNKYGVITNEEGFFSIDITPFSPQDTVKISCLGYQKQILLLRDFTSKNYFLNIQVNELSEVILTNKATLNATAIMLRVKQNIPKNYHLNTSEFNLFSRRTEQIQGQQANFEVKSSTGFTKKQLESFNTDFNQLEQSMLKAPSKQYTDLIGQLKIWDDTKIKMSIPKALRLFNENNGQSLENIFNRGNQIVLKHVDKNKIYKVKSGLFKLSDSVSLENKKNQMESAINSVTPIKNGCYNFIKEHCFLGDEPKLDFVTNINKYNYNLDDVTYFENELVYVISFFPDRSSAKFEGKIYISSSDFAILKMEYHFYEDRVGEKLNLKFLLGLKYVEKNKQGFAVYKKHNDGYYYPNYLSLQINRYFYADRPFSFIEKTKNRRAKGSRVSFEFLVEGFFKEKTELLIVSKNNLSATDFNNYTEQKRVDYESPAVYDPAIWKNFIVIEPLKEMKTFKKLSTDSE